MADTTVEVDREGIDAFLGRSGTGVISLSTDRTEPPHSVPVSYGYDRQEGVFYFRIAVGPDHGKGDLSDRSVAFVVHDEVDGRWHSVVARGTLTDVEDGDTDTLAGLERVHIPLVDIFGQQPGSVDFEFLRLDPDELTGRRESSTRA